MKLGHPSFFHDIQFSSLSRICCVLKKNCSEFIRASLNASETISLKPKNQRFCIGQRNLKFVNVFAISLRQR